MIEVKKTKTIGRGVFATQYIQAHTKIHEADFIKIIEGEVCSGIEKYVFSYTKKYSALCLGAGSLFNHCDDPSAEAYITKKDGREIMEFWTIKDIKAGEEIFISYGGEEYEFYHLLKKKKK